MEVLACLASGHQIWLVVEPDVSVVAQNRVPENNSKNTGLALSRVKKWIEIAVPLLLGESSD